MLRTSPGPQRDTGSGIGRWNVTSSLHHVTSSFYHVTSSLQYSTPSFNKWFHQLRDPEHWKSWSLGESCWPRTSFLSRELLNLKSLINKKGLRWTGFNCAGSQTDKSTLKFLIEFLLSIFEFRSGKLNCKNWRTSSIEAVFIHWIDKILNFRNLINCEAKVTWSFRVILWHEITLN